MGWQTSSLEFTAVQDRRIRKMMTQQFELQRRLPLTLPTATFRINQHEEGVRPRQRGDLKRQKGRKSYICVLHRFAVRSVLAECSPVVLDRHRWTWNTGRCPLGWYWGMILLHLFWRQNDGPTEVKTLQMYIWDENDKTNVISESHVIYLSFRKNWRFSISTGRFTRSLDWTCSQVSINTQQLNNVLEKSAYIASHFVYVHRTVETNQAGYLWIYLWWFKQ